MAVQTTQITLTNSQIKNLNATPVTIVAAQGAGTTIQVLTGMAKVTNPSNDPFINAGGGSINLYYDNLFGYPITSLGITDTMITCVVTYTQPIAPLYTDNPLSSTNYENVDIVLKLSGSVEITGNTSDDNEITVMISYMVLTA